MNWEENNELTADKLKEQLFDLVDSKDEVLFEKSCLEFKPVIVENFRSWKSVPEHLRSDSNAVSRYAAGLIAIANLFDAKGDAQFLDILEDKSNSDNPISQWENDFKQADVSKQIGDYSEAVRILERLVIDMKNCKGTAVVNYLPMVYGALGENYFFLENYELSYEITHLALEKCQENSDLEGVISYSGNLSEICKKLGRENETINWVIIATNLMLQTGKMEEAIKIRTHYKIEPVSDLITLNT